MACEAEGRMRISLVVVLLSVGLAISSTRAEARDEAVIRVRIYDYVGIAPDMLADAQRLAANFYRPTGLVIDWAPAFRPHGRKDGNHEYGKLQDFTINVLSGSMVARSTWAPDALGTAVVAPNGGGSIAYVLYDRLKNAATASGWQVKDLLAVVIAHELAHLLLGPGSHSSDGLMRSTWDVSELRRIQPSSLALTPEHIAGIRERLTQMVPAQ
jgi:hypothetical protein